MASLTNRPQDQDKQNEFEDKKSTLSNFSSIPWPDEDPAESGASTQCDKEATKAENNAVLNDSPANRNYTRACVVDITKFS